MSNAESFFDSEEEWQAWQQSMREVRKCPCQETRLHLQKAVNLLQALFDLQNGPPLEKYTRDWNCVMAYTAVELNQIEHDLGIVPVEVERGEP